jgi:uncharacterized membrane protein
VIVGKSNIGYHGDPLAVVWNGTTPTAVNTPLGVTTSYATAINNHGQFVGGSTSANYAFA